MRDYQLSLKAYRDNKNTMDYAVESAKNETRLEIVKTLKKYNVSLDVIVTSTGLTKQQVESLSIE
uniref:Uncharacterized protein n=1 Tax=Roseihalotalea indica TaxID=2867963 RepID=A0AA49GST6_9BACT|nr:hypothetical protein K4G66_03720 [Tunicatimonas sp. TK19036]